MMNVSRKQIFNELWMELSNSGISSDMPIETSRKVILTNQLSYIAFFVVFSMNVSFLFIEAIDFKFASFISSFIILINPFLNRFGYYRVSSFSFSILMSLATLFFSSMSKASMPAPIPLLEFVFTKMLLMGFLVLPLILIDSRNKLLLFTAIAINVSCIFLVETVDRLFGVEMLFSQVTFENYSRINFLIIFPIVVILVGFYFLNRINISYENTIVAQNEKLKNAHNKVKQFNIDLTTSIEYAEYIQQAILSRKELLNQWFPDSFIFYKAKSIISGDFYFFKESTVNGTPCLVVTAADCTGHGVPGGLMSVLGMTLLNEIVREGNFSSAADILNKLRSHLKEALNQTDANNDQCDGIEMALLIYYPESNRLEFSGAKNPLYIVSKNQEVTIYKANRMPIGSYLKEEAFTSVEIQLAGHEMCYLFTDGVLDQMNRHNEKFMKHNFQELMVKINGKSCADQEQQFARKMKEWMTATPNKLVEQIDDMLLMGIRIPEAKG